MNLPSCFLPACQRYDPPRTENISTYNLRARDVWLIGTLIWEIFNGHGASSTESYHQLGAIPYSLSIAYGELVNVNPSLRCSLEKLIQCPFIQNNPLTESLLFLEQIQLKDPGEKYIFFSSLPDKVDQLSSYINEHKLLPLLVNAYEFDESNSAILPTLFKLGTRLTDVDYKTRILPILTKLFPSTDQMNCFQLLQQMDTDGKHLTPAIINNDISTYTCTNFIDQESDTREVTIKTNFMPLPICYIPEPSIEYITVNEQANDDLNISDQDDSSISILNITTEGLTLAYNSTHTPITSISSCVGCSTLPSSNIHFASHYYLPKLVSLYSGSLCANISTSQMTNDQELDTDRLPAFFTSFMPNLVPTVCSEYTNTTDPTEMRLKKSTGTFISPFHCLTTAHGVAPVFIRESDHITFNRTSTYLRRHGERRLCRPIFIITIFDYLDSVYRDLALLELESAVELDSYFVPYFFDQKTDDYSKIMYPTKIIVSDSALPDESEYNKTSRWSNEFPYTLLKQLYSFKGHKISFGSLARKSVNTINKTSMASSSTSSPLKKFKNEFNIYIGEHVVSTEFRNSGAPIITDCHEWLITSPPNNIQHEVTTSSSYRLENNMVRRFHGIHIGADKPKIRSDYILLSGHILDDINANRFIPSDSPVFLWLYLSAITDLTITTKKQRTTRHTHGLNRFFGYDDVAAIKTFVGEVAVRLSTFDKILGDELLRLIKIIEDKQ